MYEELDGINPPNDKDILWRYTNFEVFVNLLDTEAAKDGIYKHPFYEFESQRLQIYEIQGYFDGKLPKLPHAERVVL